MKSSAMLAVFRKRLSTKCACFFVKSLLDPNELTLFWFVVVCSSGAQIPTVPFELPDGTTIAVGAERFGVPEALLDPSTSSPIPKMVCDSILNCDLDARFKSTKLSQLFSLRTF